MRTSFILMLLTLMLLCMIPIVGDTEHHATNLDHIDSASCLGCVVTVDLPLLVIYLSPVSFMAPIIAKLPQFISPRVLFHPPRFRF